MLSSYDALSELNWKKLHNRNWTTKAPTPSSAAAGIFHINLPCKLLADVTDLTWLIKTAVSQAEVL